MTQTPNPPSCSELVNHIRLVEAPNPRVPGAFFAHTQKGNNLTVTYGVSSTPHAQGWIETRTYKYDEPTNTWVLHKRERKNLPPEYPSLS